MRTISLAARSTGPVVEKSATTRSRSLPSCAASASENSAKTSGHVSFADFTRSVVAGLDGVERLVIDLRLNGGGDSRVIAPLLAAIQARPALRVFALIGRHTFSSGLMNAIQLDAL